MKKSLALLLAVLFTVMCFTSCSTVVPNDVGEIEKKSDDNPKLQKIVVSDFDDLINKMTEAEKNIENFSANIKCVIDLEAMGEAEKAQIDMGMEIDVKNMISHTVVNTTTESSGETTTTETYADSKASYTKDISNNWFKHSIDPEDELETKALIEKFENLTFDTSKYITNGFYQEEVYDGKECYKISYNMNLRLFELLSDIGMAQQADEFKEELSEELGPEIAQVILDSLSDLGTIAVSGYVDAYTLYPVALSLDMTQTLQVLVDKFIDSVILAYEEGLSREDLGIDLAINNFILDVTADGFNTTSVVIPENVLSAPEFTEDYIDEFYDFDDDYQEYNFD